MAEAAFNLATEPVVYHLNGATLERPRSWVTDTFHEAPYGIYPTADGAVAISMGRFADIRKALGDHPELARFDDPGIAFAQRNDISNALGAVVKTMTTADVVAKLQADGLWCAPINDLAAAFEDPAIKELNPVLEFDHPDAGHVRVLRHPARYGAGEPELRFVPPRVGEHTADVLGELGYATGEIDVLRSSGAL
jgi:crotonobetainyl-CoA:carnitine CoA-transferase CaiB-like acyl-CoA transferase